jgi:hypothetical protein
VSAAAARGDPVVIVPAISDLAADTSGPDKLRGIHRQIHSFDIPQPHIYIRKCYLIRN